MAGEGETVADDDCVKEDFALMLWAPELRWPHFYPDNKPKCPFHKTTYCVEHNGTGHHVRRCFDRCGNVALAKRRYICALRRDTTNEHPYCFDSAQKEVMDLAPDYVRGYWRQNGFVLSHKSGISFKLMDQLLALMANGSGLSGFHNSLLEEYKNNHGHRYQMWRGYTDACYQRQSVKPQHSKRSCFFQF